MVLTSLDLLRIYGLEKAIEIKNAVYGDLNIDKDGNVSFTWKEEEIDNYLKSLVKT